jgi:hypothetical protein
VAQGYGYDAKKGDQPTAEAIMKRCKELLAKRETWDNVWEEIAHYVLPTKTQFTTEHQPGAKRDRDVFDSTAISSNQMLASGLHGALTAPSGRWFHIRFRDEELNNDDEAVEWMEDCVNRMYKALEESNFNAEVNELYLDLCCFGTAAMLVERTHKRSEDSNDRLDDTLNFRTVHLGEIAISENFDGFVDTVYRKVKLTARQVRQLWNENFDVGESIERALEKNPDQEFDFIHAVYPRPHIQEVVDFAPALERPFASCWVNVKDKLLVQEGGYYEMPWLVPRWSKLSGDVYGFSPALIARADIRTLNAAKQFEMRAWEKSIDPPTLANYNGIIGDLRMDPGGLTYVRDVNGIRPFVSGAQWQVSQIKSSELVTNIRRAFFNDQLQLHEGPNMTATEVRARMELMQQILGPVIGRLQAEFLNPMLQRIFMIMHRYERFREPPAVLMESDANLDIEYVSPLARAQRMEEVYAVDRWFQQLAMMAQVSPEVMDVVDFESVGRLLAKRMGVPAEAMRGEDEIEKMKIERQQAQEQAQQMAMQQAGLEQAQQGADIAETADGVDPEQMAAVAQGMAA